MSSQDDPKVISIGSEQERAGRLVVLAVRPQGTPATDLIQYYNSDVGNASRLIAVYGERLRFCHAEKRWLVWSGQRWLGDESNQIYDLAEQVALVFIRQAQEFFERVARSVGEPDEIIDHRII